MINKDFKIYHLDYPLPDSLGIWKDSRLQGQSKPDITILCEDYDNNFYTWFIYFYKPTKHYKANTYKELEKHI